MIDKLTSAWWALKVGLGLGAFLAGLDKFFNVLADWEAYLSPLAESLLPVSGAVFMRVVGLIEIVVGLLISGGAAIGAYILMTWLVESPSNLVDGMSRLAVGTWRSRLRPHARVADRGPSGRVPGWADPKAGRDGQKGISRTTLCLCAPKLLPGMRAKGGRRP